MFDSCRMITINPDHSVQVGNYSLEQFRKCLGCKHFQTAYENYRCNRENGYQCLMERQDYFEKKQP